MAASVVLSDDSLAAHLAAHGRRLCHLQIEAGRQRRREVRIVEIDLHAVDARRVLVAETLLQIGPRVGAEHHAVVELHVLVDARLELDRAERDLRLAELVAAAVDIVAAGEGDAKQPAAQVEPEVVVQHEDVSDGTRHCVAFGVVAAARVQDAVENIGFADEGRRCDEHIGEARAEQSVAAEHAALVVGVAGQVEPPEGAQADIGRRIAAEQAEVQSVLVFELELLGDVEIQADGGREIVGVETWPVDGYVVGRDREAVMLRVRELARGKDTESVRRNCYHRRRHCQARGRRRSRRR